MPRDMLLEERLEWPIYQWHNGGPWRLGHGLTCVGPGWWPLVRRGFAFVAETPGAMVTEVKQKCCHLELRMWHPDRAIQGRLYALTAELHEASRFCCEACGAVVPPVRPGIGVTRNHCEACQARLDYLSHEDAQHAEVRLWEERAERVWPWSEW